MPNPESCDEAKNFVEFRRKVGGEQQALRQNRGKQDAVK
jgi:hypothetical protein